MLAGFDIDGTLDLDPPLFLSLMQALRAAGHRVVVLTGCSGETVEQQDLDDKQEYLAKLGMAKAYDELVVFPDPPHKPKAEWLKAHKADVLFDNSKKNAKSAPCPVLVPWQSRES